MFSSFKKFIFDYVPNKAISYFESKGIPSIMLDEDVLEFLIDTDQIDTIYGDERLVPIGGWGGDVGKLVRFYI